MSNRIKGFDVVLEKDVHEDFAATLMDAIRHMRGVLKVRPVEADSADWMNREQVRCEMSEKLWNALNEKKP